MPRKYHKVDYTIVWTVVALLMLGVAMVYSASSFIASEDHADSRFFLKSHVVKVLVGFVVMLLVARVNYRFWLRISPILLALSLVALAYMLLASHIEPIRGSKRWLPIGPVQFQPSELAKIAIVLLVSALASRVVYKSASAERALVCSLGALALTLVPIVLQPDVGTAVLIAGIAVTLIFVSGQKLRYLFLLVVFTVPAAGMMLMSSGYQKGRILQYLASLRGEDVSWQIKQSLLALGNGGFMGLGLAQSKQKFLFLPDPFTDFIYAIVGEELGILGTTLVLGLFFVLIWRGLELALRAPELSGKLLGIGLVLNIAAYVLANAGVVLNLLPTTGIPMPLLSYGGTAMIVNLFGIGILLNIASEVLTQHLLYPARNSRTANLRFKKLAVGYFNRFSADLNARPKPVGHREYVGYSVLGVVRQMEQGTQ